MSSAESSDKGTAGTKPKKGRRYPNCSIIIQYYLLDVRDISCKYIVIAYKKNMRYKKKGII